MKVDDEIVTPCAASQRTMRRMIGSPATGIAGLAHASVSGRSRVPSPAASTSACVTHRLRYSPAKSMSVTAVRAPRSGARTGRGKSRAGSRRAAAERRGRRCDAALAAFDLDEGADRRLVDRDDDIVQRELLAVF